MDRSGLCEAFFVSQKAGSHEKHVELDLRPEKKNVQGAYAHIHFYSNLHAVGDIVQLLVKRKELKHGKVSINDKK